MVGLCYRSRTRTMDRSARQEKRMQCQTRQVRRRRRLLPCLGENSNPGANFLFSSPPHHLLSFFPFLFLLLLLPCLVSASIKNHKNGLFYVLKDEASKVFSATGGKPVVFREAAAVFQHRRRFVHDIVHKRQRKHQH